MSDQGKQVLHIVVFCEGNSHMEGKGLSGVRILIADQRPDPDSGGAPVSSEEESIEETDAGSGNNGHNDRPFP